MDKGHQEDDEKANEEKQTKKPQGGKSFSPRPWKEPSPRVKRPTDSTSVVLDFRAAPELSAESKPHGAEVGGERVPPAEEPPHQAPALRAKQPPPKTNVPDGSPMSKFPLTSPESPTRESSPPPPALSVKSPVSPPAKSAEVSRHHVPQTDWKHGARGPKQTHVKHVASTPSPKVILPPGRFGTAHKPTPARPPQKPIKSRQSAPAPPEETKRPKGDIDFRAGETTSPPSETIHTEEFGTAVIDFRRPSKRLLGKKIDIAKGKEIPEKKAEEPRRKSTEKVAKRKSEGHRVTTEQEKKVREKEMPKTKSKLPFDFTVDDFISGDDETPYEFGPLVRRDSSEDEKLFWNPGDYDKTEKPFTHESVAQAMEEKKRKEHEFDGEFGKPLKKELDITRPRSGPKSHAAILQLQDAQEYVKKMMKEFRKKDVTNVLPNMGIPVTIERNFDQIHAHFNAGHELGRDDFDQQLHSYYSPVLRSYCLVNLHEQYKTVGRFEKSLLTIDPLKLKPKVEVAPIKYVQQDVFGRGNYEEMRKLATNEEHFQFLVNFSKTQAVTTPFTILRDMLRETLPGLGQSYKLYASYAGIDAGISKRVANGYVRLHSRFKMYDNCIPAFTEQPMPYYEQYEKDEFTGRSTALAPTTKYTRESKKSVRLRKSRKVAPEDAINEGIMKAKDLATTLLAPVNQLFSFMKKKLD